MTMVIDDNYYLQESRLLLENNTTCVNDGIFESKLKFDNKKKSLSYRINTAIFGDQHVSEILHVIDYVRRKYPGNKVPITFELGSFSFYDKLAYVILETLCFYTKYLLKQNVIINFDATHTIWSEGIMYSPLRFNENKKVFVGKFPFDLNGRHSRKIVKLCDREDDTFLSKLMQDLSAFLRNNGISNQSCSELSEMLVELVGNAGEHGKSDTLIDIDITGTTYFKDGNQSELFYGMNTVILNYSNTLFYEPLMEKMNTDDIVLSSRYDSIREALKIHQQAFDMNYTEKDFYTLSSFQDKISGSTKKNNETGGRGLTTLLRSLEEKADTHLCYVYSGRRILFLKQDLLRIDSNGFVGYNRIGDYLGSIPDLGAFQTTETFFPGTAYNLSFAIKKEWSLT